MSQPEPKAPALIDARAMAKIHPDTFESPLWAALMCLQPGELVKVAIPIGQTGERFWVQLTEVNGDVLIGRIDNDLLGTSQHGLAYNDLIKFARENVYSITTLP